MRHHAFAFVLALGAWGCSATSEPLSPVGPHAPIPDPVLPMAFRIDAWGDSMTAGSTESSSYPGQLASLLNRPVGNHGFPGETSSQILAHLTADSVQRADVLVLWAGNNNPTDPRVLTDIATADSLAGVRGQPLVLVGLVNGDTPGIYAGTAAHDTLLAENRQLAERYTDRFIDIRAFLMAAADPTSARDSIDVRRDVIPGSLRVDRIHLTPTGYAIVARAVAAVIQRHNW